MQTIIGGHTYNCICCTEPVRIPSLNGKVLNIFEKMFDAKKCLKCHANDCIPETAEAIRVFLVGV